MNYCFLFPGQGAQYPGMGRDLFDHSNKVRSLFEDASRIVGRDCEKLVFESTEEELRLTENTQIAVILVNLSAAIVLAEEGIESSAAAGFSLGEISALWDAGVITTESAISIAAERGRAMADAAESLGSGDDAPGMTAILGLDISDAQPVLEQLADDGVYLANHSSPTQIVIAGTAVGLKRAEPLFESAGAMKQVRLKVSGPFHSPLMEPARARFAGYLEQIPFENPTKPFVSNTTGLPVSSGLQAKQNCVEQLVTPVQWVKSEESLLRQGFDAYLEPGPGKVITGLWKSFHKRQRCQPMGGVEQILQFDPDAAKANIA